MIAQQMIIPLRMTGQVTGTANAVARWETPYAGEVLAVGGYAESLGTGAGSSTDFRLRDASDGYKEMLSTDGAFEVDSASGLLEGQVVDDTNACWASGDIIDIDCTAVTTGIAARDIVIYVTVVMFVDDL